MRLRQYLRSQKLQKSKSAIHSCSRYLASITYKLRLNTRKTKYSQNVTCVCKNIIFFKHILLECPITMDLFQKNKQKQTGYDFNDCNNATNILYNTDIIISTVKLVLHSPMGKLV